jgi:preprotein translocase subunit SecG
MTTLFWITMVCFLFLCLFMILLILIQKGRGGGISSAFGGGGGNTAFGAKTGDVLTWATSIVFALFVILAVVLNIVADKLPGNTPNPQGAPINQSTPGPSR